MVLKLEVARVIVMTSGVAMYPGVAYHGTESLGDTPAGDGDQCQGDGATT